MKKVSIYARVSVASSNPENQLVELRSVADRNGWVIIMLTTASVEPKDETKDLSLMPV